MTTPPLLVHADEYARRLRAVLGPGGGDYPRRQRDRWIILHTIARAFREDDALTEKEATARIEEFLQGPGSRLELDAVSLRRALVDEGFMDRDPAGRDYRASRRYERRVRFEGEMPEVARALAAPDGATGGVHES